MKNIVLIGSGNLAEALARAISRTEGATLLQIFARNAKRGTALALENGTAWSSDPRELAAADLYILAVSDAAITTLAESLPIPAEAAVYIRPEAIGIEAFPHASTVGAFSIPCKPLPKAAAWILPKYLFSSKETTTPSPRSSKRSPAI